jgi:hypothetical protein
MAILRSTLGAVLALALWAPALGQPARRPIGKPGAWLGTLAGVVSGGRLYTIEASGALYVTDLSKGTWRQVGKPDFANTAFLVDLGTRLATIEKDGSLYLVNPADGSWRRSGRARDWAGTTAAAVLDGRLYTTEASGALYVTDPEAGTWQALGKPEYKGTRQMFALGGRLLTIGADGSLYAVSPADGGWTRVGSSGEWRNVLAGTVAGGSICTIEADGALYATDPQAGARRRLGPAPGTLLLFGRDEQLVTLDMTGSLAALEICGEGPQPAPAAAPVSTFRGDAAAAILGYWVGDPETLLADPAVKAVGSGTKEMLEGLLAMLRSMQMTIGPDTISMEVMGEKSPPLGYRILSRTENSVTIENTTGEDKGKKATILVLDPNHIRLAAEGREANATFLKRK